MAISICDTSFSFRGKLEMQVSVFIYLCIFVYICVFLDEQVTIVFPKRTLRPALCMAFIQNFIVCSHIITISILILWSSKPLFEELGGCCGLTCAIAFLCFL